MTQQYRYNTETEQFIEDQGSLGISFYGAPWVEATQEQAKDYELKEAKKNIEGIIRANKKAFIYANVIYKDQEFINTEIASNALKIVKDEDIEPYTWLDANDNEVIFTEDDSKQLLKIMINHRKSAYLQQAQKLRQLKIANTLEEIEAIDTSFN
jgi:hypothetical protein